jgi:hypothetical protein
VWCASDSAAVKNINRKVRDSEIITSLLVRTLRGAQKFDIFVLMENYGGEKYLSVQENCIYRKIPLILITIIHSSCEGCPWLVQTFR